MSNRRSRQSVGLTVQTNTRSRKYLGDPSDPHFIPSSPILSRQILSPWEEEELTRACKQVLSGVQHSDGVAPGQHVGQLAAQQMALKASKKRQSRQDRSEYTPRPATTASVIAHQPTSFTISGPLAATAATKKTQHIRRISEDTATPSTISKQDTLDRFATDTPLTSAGITPGETSKRFFERDQRSASAQSNQRSRSRQEPQHPVYGFLNTDPNNAATITTTTGLRNGATCTKSMTYLPSSYSALPDLDFHYTPHQSHSRNPLGGTSEFNKSLPAIPHFNATPSSKGPTPLAAKRATHPRFLGFGDSQGPFPSQQNPRQNGQQQQQQQQHEDKFSRKLRSSIASLFSRKKRQPTCYNPPDTQHLPEYSQQPQQHLRSQPQWPMVS